MMQRPGKGQTVLLIDDDRDLLPSLVATLGALTSYTVVTADNGIAGLERFFEVLPDCAVVDVKMPGIDGYQFVRAVRGDPATMGVPLVILTAMTQDRDRFLGLAAGVDQYLLKPVKPLDLVAAIQNAISLGEAERQRRLETLLDEIPSGEPADKEE